MYILRYIKQYDILIIQLLVQEKKIAIWISKKSHQERRGCKRVTKINAGYYEQGQIWNNAKPCGYDYTMIEVMCKPLTEGMLQQLQRFDKEEPLWQRFV